MAVAAQGTAALLYATRAGRDRLLEVLAVMARQPWAGEIVTEPKLTALGHAARDGVVAAINMARAETANDYGVAGWRWTAAEPGKPAAIGSGQHGGFGPDETKPFLMLNGSGVAPGELGRASSLVDIAPTILNFLIPAGELDGSPLAEFAPAETATTVISALQTRTRSFT